jgi:hypothetical protein
MTPDSQFQRAKRSVATNQVTSDEFGIEGAGIPSSPEACQPNEVL